jgi:hypothetical protein
LRLLPSHTTVRTGPYTAVRWVRRPEESRDPPGCRAFGVPLRRGRFGPFARGRRSFTPTLLRKGRLQWPDFLPLGVHEVRSVLTSPFNPLARDRSGLHGPVTAWRSPGCFSPFGRVSRSACRPPLLCPLLTSAFRSVRLTTDPVSIPGQESRPPEVSFTVFHAPPPNLRFAPLMDVDFAVTCQLVRRSRLISGFCPSARVFAPRFFQTPPRGDALALR